MLTYVEKLRHVEPALQETFTLEDDLDPAHDSPWQVVADVVLAFRIDAEHFNLKPAHVEGFNIGPSFHLSTWRFE